ncbi:unnamed protein product [Withania somnifera]
MARPGLMNCDDFHEARRGKRKKTEHSTEELKLKIRANTRLIQKVSSSENADEDYVAFLKLTYNYDKNSESYTNEHGNGGSYDEVEDENEADPQYKKFLANAKRDGKSFVLTVDTKVEFPLILQYEKECDCNDGCKCLCQLKQKDIEMQKDVVNEEILPNMCSKDELKNQRFPRTDLRDDSNRSIGGVDVIFEPSNPTSQRNNRIMSWMLMPAKHGALKGQGKHEAKMKSHKEKMMEQGRRPVHVRDKEKASLKSRCNVEHKATEDDIEILYDSSDMLKEAAFRKKVIDLLEKPYNAKEYEQLWTFVTEQKPVERNMESRRGGVNSYKTNKMGKSYLHHYKDLEERLKEFDNDEKKKLKILRVFLFWLQNDIELIREQSAST